MRAPGLLNDLEPAVVVLQAGMNDLKYLGMRPEAKEAVVAGARDNLSALV